MECKGNDCRNDVDELNEDGLCAECADAKDTVDQALVEKRACKKAPAQAT